MCGIKDGSCQSLHLTQTTVAASGAGRCCAHPVSAPRRTGLVGARHSLADTVLWLGGTSVGGERIAYQLIGVDEGLVSALLDKRRTLSRQCMGLDSSPSVDARAIRTRPWASHFRPPVSINTGNPWSATTGSACASAVAGRSTRNRRTRPSSSRTATWSPAVTAWRKGKGEEGNGDEPFIESRWELRPQHEWGAM